MPYHYIITDKNYITKNADLLLIFTKVPSLNRFNFTHTDKHKMEDYVYGQARRSNILC
ncbi:hypothetical protein J2Y38_004571 [Flavobacterium sp. 2755]|nr:hypothetical protein [Flavobacterium sp. 2755]